MLFKLTVLVFVVFLFPFQYNELLNSGRLVVFKNYTILSSKFEFEVAKLQMKGRWEYHTNVWFPFMYSQKWHCYSKNRMIMFCLPGPTLIYLWEIYIFPGTDWLFCCREICGVFVDWSWEYTYMYINRPRTRECGNRGWCRAIPRKGIHKWDFPFSVD